MVGNTITGRLNMDGGKTLPLWRFIRYIFALFY